jgi:peptidoglycan lytic transglycosylase A
MRANLLSFILLLLVVACEKKDHEPVLKLTAASFEQLPGFSSDDYNGAAAAFKKNCTKIMAWPDERQLNHYDIFGFAKDWKLVCQDLLEGFLESTKDIKNFIQSNFKPFLVQSDKNSEGLFTGYYEPELRGSRIKTDQYSIPLYKRPADLIEAYLSDFKPEWGDKKITGRREGSRLIPYYSHEEIDNRPVNMEDVLVWVDSKIDSVFLQIQGSGSVRFENGDTMNVGYAAQNGHAYHAIGKTLIDQGFLERADISMHSIKDWLEDHPDKMMKVLWSNPSYVFFHELENGAVGSLGVELTAHRSLAVDRRFIPLGVPLWVDIAMPGEHKPLQQLMFAQDTGGAIKGIVRGDIFFGAGKKSEEIAGKMKQKGRYYVLLPNNLADKVGQ